MFGAVEPLELDAEAIHPVENQNLHAVESFPDFVIVAPGPFLSYAEELASRRSAEGLNVLVTPIEKIYNEIFRWFGRYAGDPGLFSISL